MDIKLIHSWSVDELVERAVRTGMAGQSAESMSSADEGRLDRQPQEMPA